MAKKLLLLGLFLLIVVSIYAKYSDDFLIGTYIHTGYSRDNTYYDCKEDVVPFLKNAHFNFAATSSGKVDVMDQYGSDVWLWDGYIMKASNASHYQYQVNYNRDTQDSDFPEAPSEEVFYYSTYDDAVFVNHNTQGKRSCISGQGYVVKDLKFKSTEGILSGQFHCRNLGNTEEDRFFIKYNMNLSNDDALEDTIPVCGIGLKVYLYWTDNPSTKHFVHIDNLISENETTYQNMLLTKENFHDNFASGFEHYNNFEYSVSIYSIKKAMVQQFMDDGVINQEIITPHNVDDLLDAIEDESTENQAYCPMHGDFFGYISPTIYYYGNGQLNIDYITMEDSNFRKIDAIIDSALIELPTNDNLTALQTMDEPNPTQFAAIGKIDSLINNYQILGAVNQRYENPFLNSSDFQNTNYCYYRLFNYFANPEKCTSDLFAQSGSGYFDYNNIENVLGIEIPQELGILQFR